jgi:hypothetical protein
VAVHDLDKRRLISFLSLLLCTPAPALPAWSTSTCSSRFSLLLAVLACAQHEKQESVKKRTALESAVVRRPPRTADFLAYVAYEARLAALRRKCVARLRAPSLLPLQ